MYNKSYESTIANIGDMAPSIDKATSFIAWAEIVADVLTLVYSKDYDTVTEDIVASAKEAQDIEDSDD